VVNEALAVPRRKMRNRWALFYRLDFYIIEEILPLLVAGIAAVILMLILSFFYEQGAGFIAKGADPVLVAKYIAYRLPEAFARGLPIALLFAVLMALTRLAQDSELKAAITSGISPGRFIGGSLFLGVFISIAAFAIQETLVPQGNQKALETVKDIVLSNPRVFIQGGQFFKDSQNQVIYVEQALEGNRFTGITVIQAQSGSTPRSVTRAERGRLLPEGAIALERGERTTYRYGEPQPVTSISFQSSIIPISDLQSNSNINLIHLSISELSRIINEAKQNGQNAAREETTLWRKFAEPFAAMAFALFGAALGLFTFRTNMNFGFVWVIFFTFFYYATWSVFRAMGDSGFLPPLLAAWGPGGIYGAAGIALLLAARQR
jgi:lipopolysaccharide export system permease protein